MTPTQTAELIEEIKSGMKYLEQHHRGVSPMYKEDKLVLEIALAALLDTENGFVMCPREPTEEMVNARLKEINPTGYNMFRNLKPVGEPVKNIIAAISARPQSALDKILSEGG